jgi:hypothetical protein
LPLILILESETESGNLKFETDSEKSKLMLKIYIAICGVGLLSADLYCNNVTKIQEQNWYNIRTISRRLDLTPQIPHTYMLANIAIQ